MGVGHSADASGCHVYNRCALVSCTLATLCSTQRVTAFPRRSFELPTRDHFTAIPETTRRTSSNWRVCSSDQLIHNRDRLTILGRWASSLDKDDVMHATIVSHVRLVF